jgi:hypothetical protein
MCQWVGQSFSMRKNHTESHCRYHQWSEVRRWGSIWACFNVDVVMGHCELSESDAKEYNKYSLYIYLIAFQERVPGEAQDRVMVVANRTWKSCSMRLITNSTTNWDLSNPDWSSPTNWLLCPASIWPFSMSTLMARCSAIGHTIIIFRMTYDHFPQPPNDDARSPQPLLSLLKHCVAVRLQAMKMNVVLYCAWLKARMPCIRFAQSPNKDARSPFSLLSLKYCVAVRLQATKMALLVR